LYQSQDSVLLKDAANLLYDKMQIVGFNIIKLNKFMDKTGHQLYHLQDQAKKHIDVDKFNASNNDMENRIKEFVEAQLRVLKDDLHEHKEELAKQVKYFNDRNTETQRDTIWKIKDVEKLLNSRISEQKVNTLLTRLSKELTSDMTMADDQLAEKIKTIEQQFKTKTDNFQSLSNLRIDQLRVDIHNYKQDIDGSVKHDEYIRTVAKLDDL